MFRLIILLKSIIVIASVIVMTYFLLPDSYKTILIGLVKLVTLLIKIKLHTLYCKFWNYNFIDEFESIVDWNPYHIQFIVAETNRYVCLQEVDELANQFGYWLHNQGFQERYLTMIYSFVIYYYLTYYSQLIIHLILYDNKWCMYRYKMTYTTMTEILLH